MNNGTVKHSCLFLPYSLVFITKLQNPEINTEFLISSCCFSRMLIVLCSQSLTNIYSVCLCEIRGFNEWKNTLIYWPFGELLTARIQDHWNSSPELISPSRSCQAITLVTDLSCLSGQSSTYRSPHVQRKQHPEPKHASPAAT